MDTQTTAATEVKVPDIGDFKDVPIIDIHVKVGDPVNAEDPLITLESDKASMDVPAPSAGTIRQVLVKVGDRVSKGTPIMLLAGDEEGAMQQPTSLLSQQEPVPAVSVGAQTDFSGVHAGPSARRIAREMGVDLTKVPGTGEKGRISKDDILAFLRGPAPAPAGGPAAAAGTGIPEIPAQDFSKFGPIETKPLSRVKRLSGPFLHRSWLNVPHVTQNDEADITETDAYRKELDTAGKEKGYRVTLLAFLIKASVSSLKQHPEFNASLSPEKDALIYKRYYNIGVAVDTPDGLVVPVV